MDPRDRTPQAPCPNMLIITYIQTETGIQRDARATCLSLTSLPWLVQLRSTGMGAVWVCVAKIKMWSWQVVVVLIAQWAWYTHCPWTSTVNTHSPPNSHTQSWRTNPRARAPCCRMGVSVGSTCTSSTPRARSQPVLTQAGSGIGAGVSIPRGCRAFQLCSH